MFSEIESIEEIGMEETIDIEVSGDHTFYANDILTHNSGFASTDLEMTDISDSFGTAMTADLIISMIENDDMKLAGKYMFKMLKSRYAPINPITQKWMMGVNKEKQQIYEIANSRAGIVTESTEPTKKSKTNSKIAPKQQIKPKWHF